MDLNGSREIPETTFYKKKKKTKKNHKTININKERKKRKNVIFKQQPEKSSKNTSVDLTKTFQISFTKEPFSICRMLNENVKERAALVEGHIMTL